MGMVPMAIVWKKFNFEAAHSLPHLPVGHKCRNKHGHGYEIEIGVRGPIDPEMGWVIDYADIASVVNRKVVNVLDHQDIDAFVSPSTAENLAIWIWKQVRPMLPRLYCVRVYETRPTCVEYFG